MCLSHVLIPINQAQSSNLVDISLKYKKEKKKIYNKKKKKRK